MVKKNEASLNWMEDVEADMRLLGGRLWRSSAEDPSKWRRIVKETKAWTITLKEQKNSLFTFTGCILV